MPKDTSFTKILVIGSGPIVIGQGCEFDYSGVQACKALKEEGYAVVLVNSNPATIMTDPEFAHRTYIEPITPEVVEKIIEREKPDALLPTLGGQTALNTAMSLFESGVLEKHGVRMIGAKAEAIEKGEDRQAFKDAMIKIGLDLPRSGVAHTIEEGAPGARGDRHAAAHHPPRLHARRHRRRHRLQQEEFETIVARGLDLSPVSEVLIEESLLGWKEFEMEVMRDRADNCVIICSIENLDPMGVHTGDSITVAPIQTLTDREYQIMRDASFAVIREIGVETGGSNIQFAVHPETGRMIVIEMNPRVSRSSALASKATGFPIAKIAAKLAVGYTLDELRNDITRETPASFEPTIDYVVTKMPALHLREIPGADATLTTQMKSRRRGDGHRPHLQGGAAKGAAQPGDQALWLRSAMARTTRTSMTTTLTHEAHRAECRAHLLPRRSRSAQGLDGRESVRADEDRPLVPAADSRRSSKRARTIAHERRSESCRTSSLDSSAEAGIDESPNSRDEIAQMASPMRKTNEARILRRANSPCSYRHVHRSRHPRAAQSSWHHPHLPPRRHLRRRVRGLHAVLLLHLRRRGRACATSGKKKIIILGGGPNRIGQGIEFDYCCVHAAFALRELGFETIMVNSNPETVSTDYDTSDKLYFEPLTLEDVLNIYEQESENLFGVIVQFGGQTPLNLAAGLEEAGVRIIGTSPKIIELAEDRKLFAALLDELGLRQAAGGTATTEEEAVAVANAVGYPVPRAPQLRARRPRACRSSTAKPNSRHYMRERRRGRPDATPDARPILVDRFLEDATEVDVDCISDGETAVIGAIMEHIEEAGIHSGDSACVIPPFSPQATRCKAEITRRRQGAGQGAQRARPDEHAVRREGRRPLRHRSQPARQPHRALRQQSHRRPAAQARRQDHGRQDAEGTRLHRRSHPEAFQREGSRLPVQQVPRRRHHPRPGDEIAPAKSWASTTTSASPSPRARWPRSPPADARATSSSASPTGRKPKSPNRQGFADLGFTIYATSGTAAVLKAAGIPVKNLLKLAEGRPNVLDMIKNGELALIINTPSGKIAREDEVKIRSTAMRTASRS